MIICFSHGTDKSQHALQMFVILIEIIYGFVFEKRRTFPDVWKENRAQYFSCYQVLSGLQ